MTFMIFGRRQGATGETTGALTQASFSFFLILSTPFSGIQLVHILFTPGLSRSRPAAPD